MYAACCCCWVRNSYCGMKKLFFVCWCITHYIFFWAESILFDTVGLFLWKNDAPWFPKCTSFVNQQRKLLWFAIEVTVTADEGTSVPRLLKQLTFKPDSSTLP
jgi:hypothetical protein